MHSQVWQPLSNAKPFGHEFGQFISGHKISGLILFLLQLHKGHFPGIEIVHWGKQKYNGHARKVGLVAQTQIGHPELASLANPYGQNLLHKTGAHAFLVVVVVFLSNPKNESPDESELAKATWYRQSESMINFNYLALKFENNKAFLHMNIILR